MTDYSIKWDENEGKHLIGWAIEGSNNLLCWNQIDDRSTQEQRYCQDISLSKEGYDSTSVSKDSAC